MTQPTKAASSNLPPKIMIVDDAPIGMNELKSFLERNQIQVLTAPDFGSALYLFNSNSVAVALIAIELKQASGLALLQKLRCNENMAKRCAGFVLCSSSKGRSTADENLTRELGGIEIIPKPFKPIALLPYLSRAYVKRNQDIVVGEFKEKVLDFHLKNNEPDRAAAAIKAKMAELGPRGLEMLLDVYEEGKKFEEGIAMVDTIMEKTPGKKDDIKMLNTKGRLLMKMGKFAEAKVYLEKCDQLAPKNMERINALSSLYLNLDLPEKSVEKMKDLCAMSPDQPSLKFDMFAKLQESGFDEAASKFCQDSTTPAEVMKHYNNSGVLKSKEGLPDGAIKEYLSAIKFFPKYKENSRIYFNLAIAYVNGKQDGWLEKSIQALDDALALDSGYDKAKVLRDKLRPPTAKAAAPAPPAKKSA